MSRRRSKKDKTAPGLEVIITLSPDGRVLFHDLTADLLAVAEAVCPRDPALTRRREIARRTGSK